MSVLKTEEKIFSNIPPITEDNAEQINRIFEPYLFFENNRDKGYRECWCSSCQKHFYYDFVQQTETEAHYEFIRAKHNKSVVCPKCGRTMTAKETFRARGCKNLEEWKRFVLIKKRSKNEVYLICGYANKNYNSNGYTCAPNYGLSAVYYLTPGYVREFLKNYDYTYLGITNTDWREPKRVTEPFKKTWWYNISNIEKRGYDLINLEELSFTFLKYVPLKKFFDSYRYWFYGRNAGYYHAYGVGECPDVKLLCYYALYPGIEILLKSNLGELVCSLVDNRPMKRYINWNGRNPKEMFGMNKAQFNDMVAHCSCVSDFKLYQELKKVSKKPSFEFARRLINMYNYDCAIKILKAVNKYKLNLTHTLNYLDKLTAELSDPPLAEDIKYNAMLWTDYIDFARQLEYDVSRLDVVFPKRLQNAHDAASAAVTALQDKLAFEAYQKRYEKLKKLYEYTDNKYQIVIPLGVHDIVEEGKILHHCVGGYADRHMKGATTILFMRRCDKPNDRLITIEVHDSEKRICQNRGKCNRSLTKDEQAFVDEWIAWVRAGSKRNKKKKSAEEAA